MSKSVVIATTSKTDLGPAPVSTDCVHNGKPDMRSKEVARSHDHTSHVMIWDCTRGRFTWNYEKDETFVVLSGEAFITNEKDEERRISPGDIVFFPAGTSSRWHVPSYIKKVAFLRHTMPRPLGFGVLAWNLFVRKARYWARPISIVSQSVRKLKTLPVLISAGISGAV